MHIAFLSGKGGTGKTSVSTNLAALSPHSILLDCDVEEPNAYLFLKPEKTLEETVSKRYPFFREEKCSHCRRCADFCRFHAILAAPALTIAMKELCHDCGGCALVCPEKAIAYKERRVGKIVTGQGIDGISMAYGIMDTGEYSGVALIHALKAKTPPVEEILIDCPPGTGCSTVAALEGADYAVIVTEPTPFGLSDMKMVVTMLREMSIPAGVIINKSGMGNREVYSYCVSEGLSILGEIPFSMDAAEHYARGELTIKHLPEFRKNYENLRSSLQKAVRTL